MSKHEIDECSFMGGFVVGGIILAIGLVSLLPVETPTRVEQCFNNPDWCAIEMPRFHKAMTAKPDGDSDD